MDIQFPEKVRKHLPLNLWPVDDRTRFEAAFRFDDVFDDDPAPGAHLSEGSRLHAETGYRRWLGFLHQLYPSDLSLRAEQRVTPGRIRDYIDQLGLEVRSTTVASYLDGLLVAMRLMDPEGNWTWLAGIRKRVVAGARPIDRLDRLETPWRLCGLGLLLMDGAIGRSPCPHRLAEVSFRDGLILATLALWPIRRRSIAALTVDRHVIRSGTKISLQLIAEDTKNRRAATFPVPQKLETYMEHYLQVVRHRLILSQASNALWVSQRGRRLTADGIYQVVRKHTLSHFGRAMGLHDVRRSAATFIAIDAPEMIGLVQPVLGHASRDTSDQHYNLAGMAKASKRYLGVLAERRSRLGKMG